MVLISHKLLQAPNKLQIPNIFSQTKGATQDLRNTRDMHRVESVCEATRRILGRSRERPSHLYYESKRLSDLIRILIRPSGKWSILPFRVLVHMGVALYAVLLDEELHPLIEGCGNARRLLSQENVHGIITSEAHDVFRTSLARTALAVRTVHHAIWSRERWFVTYPHFRCFFIVSSEFCIFAKITLGNSFQFSVCAELNQIMRIA